MVRMIYNGFFMKLKMITVGILTVLSLSTLTACNKKNDQAAAPAGQQQAPTEVDVKVVALGSMPISKTFSGRISAYQTSEVRPQVTGIIDEVLFQEGSVVRAGQPLYRISIDNYRSSVAAGEAAVAQARANVATAQANLVGAEASHAQAQADLARLEGLLEVEAISKQVYDQATTAVRTTRAAVEAARATLSQSQAAVGSAQASLSASQLDLNRTIIRAPITGKSGISAVTAGALVSSGQATSLVNISQLDPIYVDISQSSSELLQLQAQLANGTASQGSREVELVLEDGSVYPIKGQLTLSSATVNEATGAVTLRARFSNPNQILLPGMYVNARLAQSVVGNATLVPQTALMRTPKGDAQVYIVNAQNVVEVRPVTLGGTQNGQWVITGGLQNGDRVIVNGAAKVKPEQTVTPKVMADESQSVTHNQTPPTQSAPTGTNSVLKANMGQAQATQTPVTPTQAKAPNDGAEQAEAMAAADGEPAKNAQ